MAEPIIYAPEPGGISYTVQPEDLATVPEAWRNDPRFVEAARAAGALVPTAPTGEVYAEKVTVPGGIVPGAVPTPSTEDVVALPVEAPGGIIPGAVPTPSAAPTRPAARVANGPGSGPLAQVQRLITGAAPPRAALTWTPGVGVAPTPAGPSFTGEQLGLVPGARPASLTWTPGEGVAPAAPPAGAPPVAGVPATTGAYRMEAVGAPPSAAAPRLPGRPAGVVPAAQREMERAAQEQQAAIAEAGIIGARTEAARQQSLDIRAQEARRAEAEQRALADAQRQAAQKAEGDYQLALADLRTPAGEINPKRWWQNADTGQRLAAGVAAFLSGLSGGRNPVETIINEDIAAQRDQLDRMTASRREQVQGRLNLLGAMRARFSDEQAALAATKAAAFEAAAAEADKFAAQAAEGTAKVNAQAQAAEFRQKSAMAMTELQQRQAQTAAMRAQTAIDAAKLGAMTAPGGPPLTEKQRERLVMTPYHDQPIMALNKKAAENLNTATQNFENIRALAGEIVTLRRQYGSETLPGATKRIMQAKGESLRLAMKEAMNMGAAFTDSEQAMIDKIIGGDPTAYAIGFVPQMESFIGDLDGKYRRVYRLYTGRTAPEVLPGEAAGTEERIERPRQAPRAYMEPVPYSVPGRGPSITTQLPGEPGVYGIPAVPLPGRPR